MIALQCITDKGDHLLLAVKAQPRASRNAIEGELGKELRVRITAPPVDSAANEALVRFIAETAGVKRSQVELVRGGTSRHKVLAIHGLTAAELSAKLSAV